MTTTSSASELLPFPKRELKRLERVLDRSLKGWDRCPPRYVSPAPGEGVDGASFDVERVARVVRVLRRLPHTKGRWGRERLPFEPEPWQIVWILAPVFGWVDANGLRVVRELWDEVPRKNGKTSIAARLGVYGTIADDEEGAEVYAAAHNEMQARLVFGEAANVVRRSPSLAKHPGISVQANVILARRSGSVFRVLSRDAEAAHGLNVHFGIVDEIHVHKSRGLIDAIATGTGAREQPLMIYITTADDGDESSIYAEKHEYARRLADRELVDPSTYAVIWCAEKDEDPFSEKTWRAANPNYPISPTREYLEREARRAKAISSYLPTFLRLHLNVRRAEETERVDWSWSASAGLVVESKLRGRRAWGGLVTRRAQDLTSIAWLFASPERAGDWWAIWRHFLPEEQLPALLERTNGAADAWVRAGKLRLTEGNVVDVAAHEAQLRRDISVFDVAELAYDPNGAIGVIQPIQQDELTTTVAIHANTPGSALVDFEALVRARKFVHGGDPVVAWQMNSLVIRTSPAGTPKIDLTSSRDSVVAVSAVELALRRALVANPQRRSVYEDRGMLEV